MSDNSQIQIQYPDLQPWVQPAKDKVLESVMLLRKMHAKGLLGGAVMPEDANPGLPLHSTENYHFFTLPMALNYQRNSYSLWRAATSTFLDPETRAVFDPSLAASMDEDELRTKLLKHRVALQPNAHTRIWRRISASIVELLEADIRVLFRATHGSVAKILDFVQIQHPKSFPYLCGPKICNYWLYVMSQYSDADLIDRHSLNVAPDTHVIQATVRLGLVDPHVLSLPGAAQIVASAWAELFAGTGIAPIDVHTPLWLWSRGGFRQIHD